MRNGCLNLEHYAARSERVYNSIGCGEVHAGEAGAILRHAPDSTVGIDIAYFSAETMARQNDQTAQMFNNQQPIMGNDILLGLDVAVIDVFQRC